MNRNRNHISIMQGRLSPDPTGVFQFFPRDWEKEFSVAHDMGFDAIEWLFDWRDWEQNPIIKQNGTRRELSSFLAQQPVQVQSVCADYFMKYGLLATEDQTRINVLKQMVRLHSLLGKGAIFVLPILEDVAPHTAQDHANIVANLAHAAKELTVSERHTRVALESELNAKDLKAFITELKAKTNLPHIGVCYDIGNATSYGYDCAKELAYLSDLVFDVHVKDRKVRTTQSVMLGEGDAPFKECFSVLRRNNYTGPITLQAWRGDDFLADAKQQLAFVKTIFT